MLKCTLFYMNKLYENIQDEVDQKAKNILGILPKINIFSKLQIFS